MLSIQDLTCRMGGRTLLEKVSVSIPAGRRVGLVGPNGAGKSTLFKLISGEISPDSGEILLVKGTTLGMVRQDLPDDDTTLIDVVLASDTERAQLMAESETAEDPERIGYIYHRLDEIGAYEAPSRAAAILSGLGFNDKAQNSPISDFSGGWRARVALAAALFLEPDLLLLDEPTNHLDFEALVWLESFLMKYQRTMIIISHDRDILNKTVDYIIHLENQKLVQYTGNYDQFERRRAERLLNQQAMHEKQQAQKAKMMAFVERFRAKASKARQAQSRLKAIEKMDIVDAVIAERVTSFIFPEPEEIKTSLIALEKVDAGYIEGQPVLKDLNLRIEMDDRIALLGANGNGKSTLVKLLSSRLAPMKGKVEKSSKLKVGYFAQFQTDELDETLTPFEIMKRAMQAPEPKVRAALGKFGFNKQKSDTRVGELSGGEKARLLFCLMSYDAPHIMLLDEPTNHLDIDAREALMQALNNYSGAVILVSHDPHLVECVADRLWLVADGACKPYEDDLDAYRELVVRQRRKEREGARQESREKKKDVKESKPKKSGEDKAAVLKEKEALKLEEKVLELKKSKVTLENEINDCCAQGAVIKLKELNVTYTKVQQEIEQAEQALEALIQDL